MTFPSLSSRQTATLIVLASSAGAYGMDQPGGSEVVNTAVSTVTASSSNFAFSLPKWSIAVLNWTLGTSVSGSPSTTLKTSITTTASGTACTATHYAQCGGERYTAVRVACQVPLVSTRMTGTRSVCNCNTKM